MEARKAGPRSPGRAEPGRPPVQRVRGLAEPVGVLDREGEGQTADGGARRDGDGRADRADRVLLEVQHGHGGRMGVEAGQEEPLVGDGARGEAGHPVAGEVVAAAVVVELAEKALADRAGVGGRAEVDPLVDRRGRRAGGALGDVDLTVDVPADVDGGADRVAQPVDGLLEFCAQCLVTAVRGTESAESGAGDVRAVGDLLDVSLRRSIRSSAVRRSVSRRVWRASSASVTPVECRDTVSRTRRASWAEWYGAVGSCFSATVSPCASWARL